MAVRAQQRRKREREKEGEPLPTFRYCPLCGSPLGDLPPEWEPREEACPPPDGRLRLACRERHAWEARGRSPVELRGVALVLVEMAPCSHCGRDYPREALREWRGGKTRICRSCEPRWEAEMEEAMEAWQPDPERSRVEVAIVSSTLPDGRPAHMVYAHITAWPEPPDPRMRPALIWFTLAYSEAELAKALACVREQARFLTDRGVPWREERKAVAGQLGFQLMAAERASASAERRKDSASRQLPLAMAQDEEEEEEEG
jgi:hypothetical protein